MAGEVVHVEIPTQDIERGQRFWSGLFGWQFGASQMPDFDYRMARVNDTIGAAVMPGEETGHPNYYHATDDIEASLAKVKELGGSADDKAPVPGFGWFAVCKDSEGNAFHLWQADSSAA